MDGKSLKMLAIAEISENESYSLQAKKQLLNFVNNEASDAQIKSLLLNGRLENLTEETSQIIDDRFEASLQEGWFVYANWIARGFTDSENQRKYYIKTKCFKLKGIQKSICKAQAGVAAVSAWESHLKQGVSRCDKARDPGICKNRFKKAMQVMQRAKLARNQTVNNLKEKAKGKVQATQY